MRRPSPSLRTSSKTPPCQSRTSAPARREPGRERLEPRRPRRSARPAGRSRQPSAARSAARAAAASTTDSTPVSTASACTAPWRALAGDQHCAPGPAPSETRDSTRAHQVARARPPRTSGRAPRRAAARRCAAPRRPRPGAARRRARPPCAGVRAADLLAGRAPADGLDARPHARERAVERPRDERRARLRVGRQGVEPGAHRRERRRGEQAVLQPASGTTSSSVSPRPRSASIARRCGAISPSAPGGTRSRTSARAVPRSRAACSSSHGTASAYRAAVVTNSQASAAASSCRASVRFSSRTESMSGESSSASPSGRASVGARISVPAPPRRRWPARAPAARGRPRTTACPPGSARAPAPGSSGAARPPRLTSRAEQAVHQRRLAGARRAADDHQQRRVELSQPRQQVVVDLARRARRARGGPRPTRGAPARGAPRTAPRASARGRRPVRWGPLLCSSAVPTPPEAPGTRLAH